MEKEVEIEGGGACNTCEKIDTMFLFVVTLLWITLYKQTDALSVVSAWPCSKVTGAVYQKL